MTQKYLLYETYFLISDIIGRAEMKIIQDKVAQKKESKATFRVIYNHCTVPSKLIFFNYLVHNLEQIECYFCI